MDWNHIVDWIQEIFITWQWPSDYNCTENWIEWATYSLDGPWIRRAMLQTFCVARSPCSMLYKSSWCLGLNHSVPPSCWGTESPVYSSGLGSKQWEGMSCLSDVMWHCARLSLLWSGLFPGPGEFAVQVVAQPPAVSVGRAAGMSSNKVLCVDRKGMSKMPTCIAMSLVVLVLSCFLYMICPIARTYLWFRLSLLAHKTNKN